MPRFPPATIAVLKRRLLAKAGDGYRFATDDDGAEVAAVAAEAGLTPAQVKQWVVDVHDYYTTTSYKTAFLEADPMIQRPTLVAKQLFVVAWVNCSKTIEDLTTRWKTTGLPWVVKVEYSLCEITGECELFIHLENTFSINTLEKKLKKLGFFSISTQNFPNDGRVTAARSVARIREVGQKLGYSYKFVGIRDQSFESRIKGVIKKQIQEQAISDELDVVKKRRRMNDQPSSYEEQSSSQALRTFADFERSTLDAMLSAIQADDVRVRQIEISEFQEDGAQTKGGVYVARSKSIAALKVGATLRPSPWPRLKELTRFVDDPFQLVWWVPTETPFVLERTIHVYFESVRLKVPGISTEFFQTDEDAVHAFISSNKWTTASARVGPNASIRVGAAMKN